MDLVRLLLAPIKLEYASEAEREFPSLLTVIETLGPLCQSGPEQLIVGVASVAEALWEGWPVHGDGVEGNRTQRAKLNRDAICAAGLIGKFYLHKSPPLLITP